MTWSLSRLKTFEQCAAKYDYRYNLKLEDNFKGTAATRGIDVHRQIETAIKSAAPVPVEAGHMGSYIEGIKASGIDTRPEYDIRLSRDWKQVISGDYWYHGILDLLLFPTENVAHIRDWKTGGIYPEHDDQKELYALAVFCAFPKTLEIQTYFDYLDKGKTIHKVFHHSMVDAAKAKWEARVLRMEQATEFMPMPNYGCKWCGFGRSKAGPCRFG